MPDRFRTTIRLPPHDLKVDEAKFLRRLCRCLSLHIVEKRAIIRSFSKLSQERVDGLMNVFERDEAEQERRNAADPERGPLYEQELRKEEGRWREMEREMERRWRTSHPLLASAKPAKRFLKPHHPPSCHQEKSSNASTRGVHPGQFRTIKPVPILK